MNRIDINGLSHGDIVNLIKESGLHVRLTIGSPKEINGPPPPLPTHPPPPLASSSTMMQDANHHHQQQQHHHMIPSKNEQFYDNFPIVSHPQL